MLSDRFVQAITFANEIHGSQVRKGTQIPYISHLLAVASFVMEAGGSEDVWDII
jgi:(p)ppGpp synthase/HD superfamily hydrolase